MREIKFRAWNKSNKKMSKVSWINFEIPFIELDGYSANLTWGGLHPDCEIMQYTGLKDKNGKEIYEGDIVELLRRKTKDSLFVRSLTTIVKWSEQGLNYNVYPHHDNNCEWEVIGNTYENPELMEEK